MKIKIEPQKGLAEITKEERFEIAPSLNKSDLLDIVDEWQEKLKVKPNRIQIRKMRNKWSSCSSKDNITLNSELTRLPREITEYVIVHELLHLIVPNHGQTFKVLLSAYLPNWEELHYKLASCTSLFL
jgi:predicted metal-dependent hydrolase